MRRYIAGCLVAAMSVLAPSLASAADPDHELGQQIAAQIGQLKRDGILRGYKIRVNVKRGVATLDGYVRDPAAIGPVIDAARRVRGVTDVVNQVSVAEASAAPTAAVERQSSGFGSGIKRIFAPPQAPSPRGVAPVSHVDSGPTLTKPVAPVRTRRGPGLLPFGRLAAARNPVVRSTRRTQRTPAQFASATQYPSPRVAPAGIPGANILPLQSAPRVAARPLPTAGAQTPYVASYPNAAAGMVSAYNGMRMQAVPAYPAGMTANATAGAYEQPHLPNHAWPSYAAYPNYGALTYPKQYSATAWPYIGPFYPYPQVPLGWRKVTLEWDDGWWFLDFKSR